MQEISREKAKFYYALKVAASFSVLCVIIHLAFLALPIHKYNWSIFPRDIGQWYGIITGQFIHSNWGHLLSNLPPLFVNLLVLFFFYRSIGWSCFVLILTMTGFMVFLFARGHSHIGASGLIYGLISFIFFSGLLRRNVKSIILMSIMVIMYSGYLAGFVPNEEGVSWESHLSGAITGLWTAFVFRNFREADETPQRFDWQDQESVTKEYYLPRDAFEKTLLQRELEKHMEEDEQKSEI